MVCCVESCWCRGLCVDAPQIMLFEGVISHFISTDTQSSFNDSEIMKMDYVMLLSLISRKIKKELFFFFFKGWLLSG